MLDTLKERKLTHVCVRAEFTRVCTTPTQDSVRPVGRKVGDFSLPLGRQSAAAGLLDSQYKDFRKLIDWEASSIDLPFRALDLKHPITVEAEGPPVNPEGTPSWMVATWSFPGAEISRRSR